MFLWHGFVRPAFSGLFGYFVFLMVGFSGSYYTRSSAHGTVSFAAKSTTGWHMLDFG